MHFTGPVLGTVFHFMVYSFLKTSSGSLKLIQSERDGENRLTCFKVMRRYLHFSRLSAAAPQFCTIHEFAEGAFHPTDEDIKHISPPLPVRRQTVDPLGSASFPPALRSIIHCISNTLLRSR